MYEQAMSVGKAYRLDGDTDGMVEFHVDSIADSQYEELHQLVHEAEVARNGLGCNQSVFREDKDRKILIGFGQDEVINKQFIMNKKAWHNSQGNFQCRPKDGGAGIMISGMQSRYYGFGFPDFDKHKDQLNKYREVKEYHGKAVSIKVYKTSKKSPLENDPSVR